MVDFGQTSFIDGFELGGLEMAQSVIGSPSIIGSIASPAGRSAVFHLRLNPATTNEMYATWGGWIGGVLEPGVVIGGGRFYVGQAFRFSDLAPGTEYPFMQLMDGDDAVVGTLSLSTGGDLVFDDQAGSEVHVETTPFTQDVWMHLGVSYQQIASGDWSIILDGVEVGSGLLEFDFFDASTFFSGVRFLGAGVGDGNVDVDDHFFASSGATFVGVEMLPSQVFAYQIDVASATSTAGFTTNDDDLNTGQWADAAATPLASGSFAAFTDNPSDGARAFDQVSDGKGHGRGPVNGLYDVSGVIRGVQFVAFYQRGNGGGTNFRMWVGTSDQSPITFVQMTGIQNSNDTLRGIPFNSGPQIPTPTNSFAMGAGTIGAQNIEIREQWAMLVHTPDVVAADVFPLLPYKKPENVLLRR